MKNIKALLALISALVIMTSAVSCGNNEDTAPESSSLPEISAGQSDNESSDNEKDSSEKSDESSTEDSESEVSSKDDEKSTEASDSSESEKSESDESSESSNESGNEDASESESSESSDESSVSEKKPDKNNADNNNTNNSSDNNNSVNNQSNSNTNTNSNTSSSSNNNTNNNNSNNGSSSNNNNGNNTNSSGSNSNNTGNNNNSNNNNQTESNDTPSAEPVTEAPAEAPTEAPTEEVIDYAAEITLSGSPSFTGSNVTVSGQKVTITAGGIYLLEGTLTDGQVEVNTTEKVELYLNGVNIRNSSGPAIQITDAKRAEIKLLADTTNVLADAGKDNIQDGVIFSNDTLEIKGKGSLKITAGNAHGIVSDDDIIIDNGNIVISSIKSGLFANDDITINGGKLNIKAGTNGIKSKGTLNINDGYAEISGGQKEEKSSIYVAGAFSYTGGTIYASGNVVSVPTQTSIPYIVAGCTQQISSGTSVTLTLNGSDAVTFTPHSNFKCVLILSPDIKTGSSFSMKLGTENYSGYTVSDIQNVFTLF
ncbi:MAG: carbohydrate-binding domain-containing protein [Ruminococcus sp.]|nr:carbohydrate-binding domain-containing protein [Ruminococcus sp.]